MSFLSLKNTNNEGELNVVEVQYACRLGRSAVGYIRMIEVSQHKTSEGLSASEC